MLCHWSLVIQKYDFKIVHCKGSCNSNAESFSRLPPKHYVVTISLSHYTREELCECQSKDKTLSTILQNSS